MTLAGGCMCGAVRYEADGAPFHATLCHCVDCRRAGGAPAPHVANAPTLRANDWKR